MAHLYKRGHQFWISYYLNGKLVQKSLKTKNERVVYLPRRSVLTAALATVLFSAGTHSADGASGSDDVKIFSGGSRLLVIHGYSTSYHWWAFLQHKIDRYMGGPERRVVEVKPCNKSGTPIARWMNIETGERSDAWTQMLTPIVNNERDKRPVIVLSQQSLQFVYPPDRTAGIRGPEDAERIRRGADVLEGYANLVLDDGAAAVIIGMHIYKEPMEPSIGNERLALAELIRRNPQRIFKGPDVWTPTSKHHPLAFDTDGVHPNYIGAEIMAHYWFEALLKREGLDTPEWSRTEMNDAIKNKPLGLTRGREDFEKLLDKWQITATNPPRPPRSKSKKQKLDRYDKDGDGVLNEQEQAELDRARQQRNK